MNLNITLRRMIGYLGLALTLIPSFLVFAGVINPEANKWAMAIGTVLWFVVAPSIMQKE